jgi:hypothetical protein
LPTDYLGSRIVQGGEKGSAAYITLPSFYRKIAKIGPKTEMAFEIHGDSITFTPIRENKKEGE